MKYDNPVSRRILDIKHNRLIYIGENATPELWDSLWNLDKASVQSSLQPSPGVDQLALFTKRFLNPSEGPILEGGCGKGQFVASLQRAGFNAIGLDFAQESVKALNKHAPELDIRFGDLRAINMPNESVAGFWSLGVIEHFWSGYEPLLTEMARVVKIDGYLFCSFPYMNPLRRLKARAGLYPTCESQIEPSGFYQFALDYRTVIRDFSKFGFQFIEAKSSSGLKGALGEFGIFSSMLERLYYYPGSSICIRGIRKCLETLFCAFGTGHSIQIVFRKAIRVGNGLNL